jgi:hypothetical protein
MGFFIGWRYFEEKDRYSFEARQEQERLRREKKDKERRAQKKERIQKKKKAEKKKKLQEEWRQEAASYQSDQFGLDTDVYKSGYINEDGESYKDQIAAQYGGGAEDFGGGKVGLNRGMSGAGPRMKKLDGDSPFNPKNKMPAGMNSPGMENNAAVKDGTLDGPNAGQQKKGAGSSSCNPMGGGMGRSMKSRSGWDGGRKKGGGNFSGKLQRPL